MSTTLRHLGPTGQNHVRRLSKRGIEGAGVQVVRFAAAEQRPAGGEHLRGLLGAVDQSGQFLGQCSLGCPTSRSRHPLGLDLQQVGGRSQREHPQESHDVPIIGVEPELVEGVRARQLRSSQTAPPAVLPNFSPSAFTTNGTVKGVGARAVVALHASDQVEAGRDVAPLV